jgi:hypothetical protein
MFVDELKDLATSEVAAAERVDFADPVAVAAAEKRLLAGVEMRRAYESWRRQKELFIDWRGFVREDGVLEIRAKLCEKPPCTALGFQSATGRIEVIPWPPREDGGRGAPPGLPAEGAAPPSTGAP